MSSRKQEIFNKALSLMKTKGYANTTVRDIASAVNMEAASLYNHISSKEDLLALTCFDLAARFEKGILEVNDIYFDAKEKLRDIFQLINLMILKQGAIHMKKSLSKF